MSGEFDAVVVGSGSRRITGAMIKAIVGAGGQVETGRWVRCLDELPAAQAVLGTVMPRGLLSIAGQRLPGGSRDGATALPRPRRSGRP